MDWIENIQIKSYTNQDRDKAIDAFHQISSPVQAEGLEKLALLRSLSLENELNIFLCWNGSLPSAGKSRLGLQLASAFAEFGPIYHSGWQHSAGLTIQPGRCMHEHQSAV